MFNATTQEGAALMFTGDEDMQATALQKKGWTISAIARHLERDRKTVRAHLRGDREAGVRKRSGPDLFEPFVAYAAARLREDPHLWASALYDELVALGYDQSYQSLTRNLRARGLRPHCEACDGVKGRATIEIEHPPGAEIQWDWDELGAAPWGSEAHLLVGSLPCSGRFRGFFADSEDQAYLVEALDAVLRRLGGTAPDWRFDRMATVVDPKTGVVQPSRAGRQALRRACPRLPAEAREPEGLGREVDPLRHRGLLAHDDGAHPGGRAGVLRPLL